MDLSGSNDAIPLPYTLRRPFFTFFRRFSYALLPVAAVVGALTNGVGFLLILLLEAALWIAFGLAVYLRRESITVYNDRLLFHFYGKQHSVLFGDIRWVDVFRYSYSGRVMWIAWQGAEDRPLRVTLDLFPAKDRRFLLGTIARLAPQAPLNAMAHDMA
jgi:CRISPR-associated Cas5-like protein